MTDEQKKATVQKVLEHLNGLNSSDAATILWDVEREIAKHSYINLSRFVPQSAHKQSASLESLGELRAAYGMTFDEFAAKLMELFQTGAGKIEMEVIDCAN